MIVTAGARLWLAATTFLGLLTVVSVFTAGGKDFSTVALGSVATAAFVIALVVAVLRDGDVAAPDSDAPVESDPTVTTLPAGWPAVAALGVGVLIIGWAAGGALFYVGLGILAVVLVEWMVQSWAERATGDPSANQALRNKIMFPVEIPATAVLVVGVVVLAFSRVLLALPKTGSTAIAIVVAALVLTAGFLVANRPRVGSSAVTGLAVVGAVALLGGGIGGAVAGEREFHPHDEGGHGEEITIVAEDIAFQPQEVEIQAGEEVTLVFDNRDEDIPHNLHLHDVPDGPATEIFSGPAQASLSVTVDESGEYSFMCDVHPEMQGTLLVTGESGGGGGDGSSTGGHGDEGHGGDAGEGSA